MPWGRERFTTDGGGERGKNEEKRGKNANRLVAGGRPKNRTGRPGHDAAAAARVYNVILTAGVRNSRTHASYTTVSLPTPPAAGPFLQRVSSSRVCVCV